MKQIGNYKIEFDNKKVTKIFNKEKLVFELEYNDKVEETLPKLEVVVKRLESIIKKLEKDNKKIEIKKERYSVLTFSLIAALLLSYINFQAIFWPLLTLEAISTVMLAVTSKKFNQSKNNILNLNILLDQQLEQYHNIEEESIEKYYTNNSESILKKANVNTNVNEKNKTLIK